MDDVIDFILDKIPMGVIVFDKEAGIIYMNRQAASFLKRFELPGEIASINRRIFDAIKKSALEERFPGEIYLSRKLEGSPNSWMFRFFISEKKPAPFVCLFIIEEKISNKVDMNNLRQTYRLTRRETDILRYVLDGSKNADTAENLRISEQTVKDHLSRVYMKLGVENRFELIRFLISPSDTKSGDGGETVN